MELACRNANVVVKLLSNVVLQFYLCVLLVEIVLLYKNQFKSPMLVSFWITFWGNNVFLQITWWVSNKDIESPAIWNPDKWLQNVTGQLQCGAFCYRLPTVGNGGIHYVL